MTAASSATATDKLTAKLDSVATKASSLPVTGEVLWRAERTDSNWSWGFGGQDTQFFIASVTKLYTTALVLQLVDRGVVSTWMPQPPTICRAERCGGLNTHGGTDHSAGITVRPAARPDERARRLLRRPRWASRRVAQQRSSLDARRSDRAHAQHARTFRTSILARLLLRYQLHAARHDHRAGQRADHGSRQQYL